MRASDREGAFTIDGVKNAKVDWKAKTATVEVPAAFDRQKIRAALTNAGFESVFPVETMNDER